MVDFTKDYSFKYLFKSPKTRFFLAAFLSELLQLPLKKVEEELKMEDTELIQGVYKKNERGKVTDVLVSVGDITLDIEMNRVFYNGVIENKFKIKEYTGLSKKKIQSLM